MILLFDSHLDNVPSIGLFILHFLAIFLTNIANGRIRGSFNFGLTAEYAFNSHVFLFKFSNLAQWKRPSNGYRVMWKPSLGLSNYYNLYQFEYFSCEGVKLELWPGLVPSHVQDDHSFSMPIEFSSTLSLFQICSLVPETRFYAKLYGSKHFWAEGYTLKIRRPLRFLKKPFRDPQQGKCLHLNFLFQNHLMYYQQYNTYNPKKIFQGILQSNFVSHFFVCNQLEFAGCHWNTLLMG